MATLMEEFIKELRDNYHIKRNCDYAIASKYGKHWMICSNVFLPRILEVAKKFNVDLELVACWDVRS